VCRIVYLQLFAISVKQINKRKHNSIIHYLISFSVVLWCVRNIYLLQFITD